MHLRILFQACISRSKTAAGFKSNFTFLQCITVRWARSFDATIFSLIACIIHQVNNEFHLKDLKSRLKDLKLKIF